MERTLGAGAPVTTRPTSLTSRMAYQTVWETLQLLEGSRAANKQGRRELKVLRTHAARRATGESPEPNVLRALQTPMRVAGALPFAPAMKAEVVRRAEAAGLEPSAVAAWLRPMPERIDAGTDPWPPEFNEIFREAKADFDNQEPADRRTARIATTLEGALVTNDEDVSPPTSVFLRTPGASSTRFSRSKRRPGSSMSSTSNAEGWSPSAGSEADRGPTSPWHLGSRGHRRGSGTRHLTSRPLRCIEQRTVDRGSDVFERDEFYSS